MGFSLIFAFLCVTMIIEILFVRSLLWFQNQKNGEKVDVSGQCDIIGPGAAGRVMNVLCYYG